MIPREERTSFEEIQEVLVHKNHRKETLVKLGVSVSQTSLLLE